MEEKRREEYPWEEDEIDLYELWQRLWKRRRFIGGVVFIAVVVAVVVSLLMTPIYRSEATLMPVSKQPIGGLAEIASQFLGIPKQTSDTSSKIIAVLRSRTIKERVIRKLNLVDIFFEEKPENRNPINIAVALLDNMVYISSDKKTGAIGLKVEYKDPEIARKIANAYIEELQRILEEKALTVAKVNRMFLEKQLKATEEELKEKLRMLASFQKREKVIVPQEQVKGTFELYTELISKKVALQVELKKLQSILSPSSPQITAIKEQLRAIESQIDRIENSSGLSAIPSLESAPEKISAYTQIYLKVKGLQAKYETLLKLYEQAKLEEQKESIYVEVIDPPSLPDIPVKPKKKLIVAVAGVSSLFLGIFLALFLEWLEEARKRYRESSIES